MSVAPRIAVHLGLGLLLVGSGCSHADMADVAASEDTDAHYDPSHDTGIGTKGADSGEPLVPVWWVIDGSLAVVADEVDLANSSLTITLLTQELTVACATTRALATADLLDPTTDELHGLWRVVLADGEGCAEPVPADFELGVGPYDPQLDPALDSTGLDGATLFGLYLRQSGNPLYVFGIAGTPAQFAGTAPEVPPLPDGLYTLDGLHVLPL